VGKSGRRKREINRCLDVAGGIRTHAREHAYQGESVRGNNRNRDTRFREYGIILLYGYNKA